MAKFLNKKVIIMPGGVAKKVYLAKKDPLTNFLSLIIMFNIMLADKLIIYSPHLLDEAGWKRFQHKTTFAHQHFIDFSRFRLIKQVNDRQNIVGYVGRLSEEKGILNLIKAIPFVFKEKNIQLVVCGEGNLMHVIRNLVKGLENNVKFTGWIHHQDLPQFLNEMRLLIMPSFTEGLPNVILEAMACGTPVLVTPVGAIPDIVKDGETGFLLKSNEPKHIAEKVIELLNKPELLEGVSINAYNFVRANFSFEKTLESWRRILQEVCNR
jgi:glycosyltransferase involved in cell wall biosynthesis